MRDTGRILITLLAAAVTFGLTRVAVPGAEEVFAATGLLELFDAKPFHVAQLGLSPFLAASLLGELVSFVVPSWRRAPEAGGTAELMRRRVALAASGVLVLVVGWSNASAFSALGGMVGPLAGSVWSMTLTLASGSALLFAIASVVDERGLGSGIALVHGIAMLGAVSTTTEGSVDLLATVVPYVFPLVLVVWALSWDRAPRQSGAAKNVLAVRLPEPAGGLIGFALAILVLSSVYTHFGTPEGMRQAEAHGAGATGWAWLAAGAALAGALGLGAALLFNRPARISQLWSRVVPGAPSDDLESAIAADVVDAGVRTGLLCAAAFALMSALGTAGVAVRLEPGIFLGLALVEIVRDLRSGRSGVAADEDTRAWAAVAKVELLRRAGIEPVVRHRGIATLFPLCGPLLPVVIQTPRAEAQRARAVLDALVATEPEPATAPAVRIERVQRGVVPIVVTSLLLGGGIAAPFVITGVRDAQDAAAGPVKPISFRMAVLDDDSEPFAAWGRNPRLGPEGVLYRLEDAPLGRGRTQPRTYAYVEPTAGETMKQVRDRVHPDLAAQLPPGRMLVWGEVSEFDLDKNEFVMTGYRTFVVDEQPILTEADVREAAVTEDITETGPQVSVAIDFSRQGAEAFEAATEANVQRRIALIVDGQVMSAPVVQSKISGGSARITMGRNPLDQQRADAERLARGLRAAARKR